jgi:hypothetical protein
VIGAAFLALALRAPAEGAAPPAAAPTFCAEWVRQSKEGYERLTLFSDRMLVWKTSRSGTEDVKKKALPPEEAGFYCAYFARPEFWELPEDSRTKLTGDLAAFSLVQLTRPDGARKQVRFDEFSALTPDGAQLRSALEGLKGLFTNPVAPATRFTPERLAPGTILKRFDGALFRVRGIHGEHVELEGVSEPYRFFMKVSELRYQFAAPE